MIVLGNGLNVSNLLYNKFKAMWNILTTGYLYIRGFCLSIILIFLSALRYLESEQRMIKNSIYIMAFSYHQRLLSFVMKPHAQGRLCFSDQKQKQLVKMFDVVVVI